MDENNPRLIEPGVKYFIKGTLKECKKFKQKYNNKITNIVLTLIIIVSFTLFLLYRYKGKITKEEIEQKNIKKQEYIISKLQQLSNYNKNLNKNNNNMITDLPLWNNNSTIDILNRKIYN